MVASFRKARKGGLSVTFGVAELRVLQRVFGEMLELLGPADEGGEDDPLAAAVGIGTATTAPDDPALARLFPDGYTDDAEASSDFRRYTEPGLRAQKREALETALATLEEPGQRVMRSAHLLVLPLAPLDGRGPGRTSVTAAQGASHPAGPGTP